MPVKLSSSGGGSVTLDTPSTASNLTVTLPSASGTLATTSGSLSSPTITGTVAGGASYTSPTLTGPTMSGTVTGGTYASASITAANSNTVEATSGPTSTQLGGMRNKIINGAMMIDQRNAGASVTPTANAYTLDRWNYACGGVASKFAIQQNAGAVTPPAGFTKYLGATSQSAYSISTTDRFFIQQGIEGFNVSDLAWGTSSAKTITVSFWVRSSLTGTFGGSVQNNVSDRSYPFSYSIPAANTWTYITITIPGDTSGTWLTDSNGGVWLLFGLGVGSTVSGTAGSWQSGNYISATGATSVVGTSGATFYITGVQLEKGATATPFENRLYGTELALCQRYYEKSYDQSVVPGTASSYGGGVEWVANTTDTNWLGGCRFSVVKRATPTVSIYSCDSGSANVVNRYAGSAAINVSSVDNAGQSGFMRLILASIPATAPYRYQFVAVSEL